MTGGPVTLDLATLTALIDGDENGPMLVVSDDHGAGSIVELACLPSGLDGAAEGAERLAVAVLQLAEVLRAVGRS